MEVKLTKYEKGEGKLIKSTITKAVVVEESLKLFEEFLASPDIVKVVFKKEGGR